jgi:hypothetical protein
MKTWFHRLLIYVGGCGLIACGFASYAHALEDSSALITSIRNPGLERKMQKKVFTLYKNGQMIQDVYDFRTHGHEQRQLGFLSLAVVTDLMREISSISPGAKLIDAQAGRGFCYDLPGYSVSVVINGIEKEISRKARCHNWNLESKQGMRLSELGELFLKF